MKRFWAVLCFLGLQALVGAALMMLLLGILTTDVHEMRLAVADADFWRVTGVAFLGVCTLQAIVFLPLRARRPRRERGVSLWVSLGAAALLVGLLVGAFVLAICDALSGSSDVSRFFTAGALVTAIAWGAAALLFTRFLEKNPDASREDLLNRLTRTILAGTAFEAVALIPFDLMIRQRTKCYCAAGTLFGWAVTFAVGLVVLGPAVLLPLLARRRERWYAERCDACAVPLALADAHVAGYRGPILERCGSCGVSGRVRRPDMM